MGTTIEAIPTPIPPTIRNSTNIVNEVGKAVPTEFRIKSIAVMSMVTFRPNVSLKKSEKKAPIKQPTNALEIAQPVSTGDKWKNSVKFPIAPDITAVSYPNNKPPNAALNAIKRM